MVYLEIKDKLPLGEYLGMNNRNRLHRRQDTSFLGRRLPGIEGNRP